MERSTLDHGKSFQESILRKLTTEFIPTLRQGSLFTSTMSIHACSSFLEEMKLGKILTMTGVKEEGNIEQICIDYCSLSNTLFSKNLQFKYNIINVIKISQSLNHYKFQL